MCSAVLARRHGGCRAGASARALGEGSGESAAERSSATGEAIKVRHPKGKKGAGGRGFLL